MFRSTRYRNILLLVIILVVLFPSTVDASWMGDKVEDAINDVLGKIMNPIYSGMLSALRAVLINPTNMRGIKYIDQLELGMQVLAGALLVTTIAFRGLMYMINGTTGGNNAPISDILARSWMAAILIFGLPWILENVFLKLNEFLMAWVNSIGVDFQNGLLLIVFPSGQGLTNVIMFCIWLLSLIGLLWSNAVRCAELIFLYIIAPLLAVSQAGRGEALQMWIIQAISVSLTQVVQFALVGLSFNLMQGAGFEWWTYITGIGAIVLAIRGPQVIKQFLYTTGTASGGASAAQQVGGTVMYKAMMKGVIMK